MRGVTACEGVRIKTTMTYHLALLEGSPPQDRP